MSNSVIKNLAELLRRVQGRIDKETGEDIDIGDLVQDLRSDYEKLEAEIERLRPDAERWQETMLEWGEGAVNGFGDFWDRISAQMTPEEQQAAIDAAMEESENE